MLKKEKKIVFTHSNPIFTIKNSLFIKVGWKGIFKHYKNMPMQYTEIFKVVNNENFSRIFFFFLI